MTYNVNFEDIARDYHKRFVNSSWAHPVPGWEPQDLQNEMLWCLWKAYTTYNPPSGVQTPDGFSGYWWHIWNNHRKNLLESAYTKKNSPTSELEFPEEVAGDDTTLVPPPKTLDPLEKKIWVMISYGFTVREITNTLKISIAFYYKVIQKLRTEEIKNYLKD